jgi:HPt (histidine-containing phosphotransfer) domain-containing protein
MKPELDPESLDRLVAVMSFQEAEDFVQAFLDEAGERIARMRNGTDLVACGNDAHALVSTAGNVGAMRVSELARSVEVACRSADEVAVRNALAALAKAFDAASTELTAWLRAQSLRHSA